MKEYIRFKRGFSLAELGIAMVILLIVSTIAVISYFSIIDNTKEVKIIEDSKTLQLALVRQEIDVRDYSTEYKFEDLDQKIQDILNYHYSVGTNLKGVVFPNEVILDSDGNYVLGELKVKRSEIEENISLLDILNINKVRAEKNTGLGIEIRKLDNNQMNKLIQDNLSGDWFIISDYKSDRFSEDVNNENGNKLGDFIKPIERLIEVPDGFVGIYTAEDLDIKVRDNLSGNFILMNDIDLSSYSENGGWVPIGETGLEFSGVFDGNGHIISNLYIDRPTKGSQALFSFIKDAEIKNVGLLDVNIKGRENIAGLVANVTNSVIENAYFKGNVEAPMDTVLGGNHVGGLIGKINLNSNVKDSFAEGTIVGKGYLGGLIGNSTNDNNIVNSYFNGIVIGSGDRVGGLIGRIDNTNIKNTFAYADVKGNDSVGILIGQSGSSTILNSFSSGNVTANKYVGGLIGSGASSNTVRNTYSIGVVEATASNVGGLLGTLYGSITNSYFVGTVKGSSYVGGLLGYSQGLHTSVNNSFWDKETSGLESSASKGNFIGLTSLEMKNTYNFTDWDKEFLDDGVTPVWILEEGEYPKLWFEK